MKLTKKEMKLISDSRATKSYTKTHKKRLYLSFFVLIIPTALALTSGLRSSSLTPLWLLLSLLAFIPIVYYYVSLLKEQKRAYNRILEEARMKPGIALKEGSAYLPREDIKEDES